MEKIKMTTPLVEMDGDEMTRILWKMIKEELLLPFVDLKTEYYDLGLSYRNETDDQAAVKAFERGVHQHQTILDFLLADGIHFDHIRNQLFKFDFIMSAVALALRSHMLAECLGQQSAERMGGIIALL